MRVLYVALTRPKEKLIITGLEKDFKKSIDKKQELLDSYQEENKTSKIDKNIIQKYKSYLDWIELVNLKTSKELESIIIQTVHEKEEILKQVKEREEEKEQNLEEQIKKVGDKNKEEIKQKLNWQYGYKQANGILTKSSVTKIKNMKLDLTEEQKEAEYKVPEFMQEEKELTSAEKGTLMHLILQKLDEKQDYDKQKIQELIDKLVQSNIINEKQKEAVEIEKILTFTKTKIWEELKQAKEIQREKPFYINIKVKEIYEEDIEEEVLVQGIIDLYYETKEGKLILVDYKTDKTKQEAELIDKYKEQLKIYKKALEQGTKKQVEAVYIYSVYLDKEIQI